MLTMFVIVSSIKAIAEVLKVKLASVTSLETLAANVNDAKTIVSLIDARNNQVYCGIFDENYDLKEEALADDINEAIAHIKKYDDIVIQIHDNPDADAVGSGYAIYQYLKEQGQKKSGGLKK